MHHVIVIVSGRIQHDNTGRAPGWLLERVSVYDVEVMYSGWHSKNVPLPLRRTNFTGYVQHNAFLL